MTQLDPKALEAACRVMHAPAGKPFDAKMADAITAYLSALPPPAEAGELVAKLRTTAIGGPSWVTHDAADLIQSLSLRLETVTRERDEAREEIARAIIQVKAAHKEQMAALAALKDSPNGDQK